MVRSAIGSCIHDFVLASGIHRLPDNPTPLDFFLAFVGNDFLEQIVNETIVYTRQKLADSSARIAEFQPVTEIKAFIVLSIFMGTVRLPSLNSYWSRDDFFRNVGIKKVMPRNRFTEISSFFFCIFTIHRLKWPVAIRAMIDSSREDPF